MFIVSYDIVDDKTRSKVAKLMEAYGVRVQKSVFECELNEKQLIKLKNKLAMLIDHETDSVRFYRQCKKCRSDLKVLGNGVMVEQQSVIIV